MPHKVLLVDDDVSLLNSFRRHLGRQFSIDIAQSGEEGLVVLKDKGPFAVIISDYRMPGMTGLEFLEKVKEVEADTVRILLTGHAELDVVINAVNKGNIFRMLTKPCPKEIMLKALEDGIKTYDLIQAEKELLEKTLKGSVKMLCELLAMMKPEVFGRISRAIPFVRRLSVLTGDPSPWMTETAAMLSLVGYIMLPEKLIRRAELGRSLSAEEYDQFGEHPIITAKLLNNIPRMKEIALIVAYQEKHFDGNGLPRDNIRGGSIPLGARIIRIALDFEQALKESNNAKEAGNKLRARNGWYDPEIIKHLDQLYHETKVGGRVLKVTVEKLSEGFILADDVYIQRDSAPICVLSKGQDLSQMTILYLEKYKSQGLLVEPIKIYA